MSAIRYAEAFMAPARYLGNSTGVPRSMQAVLDAGLIVARFSVAI